MAKLELIENAYDGICAFSKKVSEPIELNAQEVKSIQRIIRNIVAETTDILINIDRVELSKKNIHNEGKETKDEKSNLFNNAILPD